MQGRKVQGRKVKEGRRSGGKVTEGGSLQGRRRELQSWGREGKNSMEMRTGRKGIKKGTEKTN